MAGACGRCSEYDRRLGAKALGDGGRRGGKTRGRAMDCGRGGGKYLIDLLERVSVQSVGGVEEVQEAVT